MKSDAISRDNTWPLAPGDPGWPTSLRSDPAGPIMADAVITLVHNRGQRVGDPLAALCALIQLIAAGKASIPDAVADARAHYYSWDELAEVLGVDAATVQRRYRRYCETGR